VCDDDNSDQAGEFSIDVVTMRHKGLPNRVHRSFSVGGYEEVKKNFATPGNS
jgi:hypothetical protein